MHLCFYCQEGLVHLRMILNEITCTVAKEICLENYTLVTEKKKHDLSEKYKVKKSCSLHYSYYDFKNTCNILMLVKI